MIHASHPNILVRLKRADGHLRSVIAMMEASRPCLDLAQQLHAVEAAIAKAKKQLIQDHIDHCLSDAVSAGALEAPKAVLELKLLAKYL